MRFQGFYNSTVTIRLGAVVPFGNLCYVRFVIEGFIPYTALLCLRVEGGVGSAQSTATPKTTVRDAGSSDSCILHEGYPAGAATVTIRSDGSLIPPISSSFLVLCSLNPFMPSQSMCLFWVCGLVSLAVGPSPPNWKKVT